MAGLVLGHHACLALRGIADLHELEQLETAGAAERRTDLARLHVADQRCERARDFIAAAPTQVAALQRMPIFGGIRADVLVAIHVAPSGEIDDALVREAVTDPPGSTRAFELTALEALRLWRVRLPPGEGYAQGCWLTVPIEYRPEDELFDRLDRDGIKPEPANSAAWDETGR